MTKSPIGVGLSSCGRIVIAVTARCGCCRIERELSFDELRQFTEALVAQTEIARRVLQLPLPWIHEEGWA